MKKSVLLLALAAFTIPARAELITLDAPASPSGSFDVFVNLTNVFDPPHATDFFLGYGFDVSYDHTILSYLGETPGALFTDLSGNPGITAQVAGIASSVLLGPGDFTEPLNLAVLHFGITGSGPTAISISGDTSNLDQGLIYLSTSDPISASRSLTATAVPEPSAISLLSFAVLALLIARCSRRGARLTGIGADK
jgi:hypothetical protein